MRKSVLNVLLGLTIWAVGFWLVPNNPDQTIDLQTLICFVGGFVVGFNIIPVFKGE